MKRLFDFILACITLFLTIPVLLIVAMLIKVKLGSPVIFSQMRPGMNGIPFRMYKFRSMLNNCGPDRDRITSFGKSLRSTSLDELPAIWNVIKGDMSFVGPRPLLVEYLPLYSPRQARRHEIKPGITGWAQINGRNAISWDEKFELDVWYVENYSFWLDFKILLLTVKKVFRKEDISAEGHVTIEPFKGSNSE